MASPREIIYVYGIFFASDFGAHGVPGSCRKTQRLLVGVSCYRFREALGMETRKFLQNKVTLWVHSWPDSRESISRFARMNGLRVPELHPFFFAKRVSGALKIANRRFEAIFGRIAWTL